MKIADFSHNDYALEKIEENIENNVQRMCIVHATGTGKTQIISQIIKRYKKEKSIIIFTANARSEMQISQYIKGENIVNYASFSTTCEYNIDYSKYNADIYIFDECHHILANITLFRINKILNNNKNSFCIGLTATHKRTDGKDVAEEFFNGNIISTLPLIDCFEKGILKPPIYIPFLYRVDNSDISTQYNDILKTYNIAKMGMVEFYFKKYYNPTTRKIICFVQNKTTMFDMENIASNVFDWLQESHNAKKINVFKMHSKYEYSHDELSMFNSHKPKKDEYDILISINMLNEGVHIDNIDLTLMMRPTKSHIIFYQQIGRSLSIKKDTPTTIFDFAGAGIDISETFVRGISKTINRIRKSSPKNPIWYKYIEAIEDSKNIICMDTTIKSKLYLGGPEAKFKYLKEWVLDNSESKISVKTVGSCLYTFYKRYRNREPYASWFEENYKFYNKRQPNRTDSEKFIQLCEFILNNQDVIISNNSVGKILCKFYCNNRTVEPYASWFKKFYKFYDDIFIGTRSITDREAIFSELKKWVEDNPDKMIYTSTAGEQLYKFFLKNKNKEPYASWFKKNYKFYNNHKPKVTDEGKFEYLKKWIKDNPNTRIKRDNMEQRFYFFYRNNRTVEPYASWFKKNYKFYNKGESKII